MDINNLLLVICDFQIVVKAMSEEKTYWSKIASRILKTELAKRGMTYIELVKKLQDIGVDIKVEDLRGRLARGTFGAILFVQCLKAMDVKNLLLEESLFEKNEQ